MQHARTYSQGLCYVRTNMRPELLAFIERGIEPGLALAAVLRNDLRGALVRLDDDALSTMRGVVRFLTFYAPPACWGSAEKVRRWMSQGGIAGLLINERGNTMKTTMTVLRVGQPPENREVDLPEEPGYDALARLIRPLLDGKNLEHVAVLHEGARRDMFVDETGRIDALPRNDAATAIYRTNWMTQHPGIDPETLSAIHGTAILFSRRVWF